MSQQIISEHHLNIIKHVMGEEASVKYYTHPQDGLTLAIAHPKPLSDTFLDTVSKIFNSGDAAEFVNINDVLSTDNNIVWAISCVNKISEIIATKTMSGWLPEVGRIDIKSSVKDLLGEKGVVTQTYAFVRNQLRHLVYVDGGSFTPEDRLEINELFRGDDSERDEAIERLQKNPLAVFEIYETSNVGVNYVALLARVKTLKELYRLDRELNGTISVEVKKIDDDDGTPPYFVYRNFKLDVGDLVIPSTYKHAVQSNALETFKQNSNKLILAFITATQADVKTNATEFVKLEIPCSTRTLFTSFTITAPQKPTLPRHATNLVSMGGG